MNILRLRELLAAWQAGAIREAELLELRDALPEVLLHASLLLPFLASCTYADHVGDVLNDAEDVTNRLGFDKWADEYELRYILGRMGVRTLSDTEIEKP